MTCRQPPYMLGCVSVVSLCWQSHGTDAESIDNSRGQKRRSREAEKRAERQLDHALEDFFDVDEEGMGKDDKDEDEEDEQMLMVVRV